MTVFCKKFLLVCACFLILQSIFFETQVQLINYFFHRSSSWYYICKDNSIFQIITSPMVSSRNFIVSSRTFKCMIHLS